MKILAPRISIECIQGTLMVKSLRSAEVIQCTFRFSATLYLENGWLYSRWMKICVSGVPVSTNVFSIVQCACIQDAYDS